MMEHIIKKIREADMVLVGIGEELDALNEARKFQDPPKESWMLPYIEKLKLQDIKEQKSLVYHSLAGWLGQKNYFLVTLCQDGLARECGLDEKRIVEPCGGYRKLQCSKKCSMDLYDLPEGLLWEITNYMEEAENTKPPVCPVCPLCNSPLVFNNIQAEEYVEEGYLNQWSVYRKWLQGTVNKKIVLLEVGVGMKYPTVIRWAFEKIVYYNQKAELFRIHSRIYQLTEEIRERGSGICQNPEEFLKELSKGFQCVKLENGTK